MRILLPALLLAACDPYVAASRTPEDFVPVFIDLACEEFAACGTWEEEECREAHQDWYVFCTSDLQPDWDPDVASECLHDIGSYACNLDYESSPCMQVCD